MLTPQTGKKYRITLTHETLSRILKLVNKPFVSEVDFEINQILDRFDRLKEQIKYSR